MTIQPYTEARTIIAGRPIPQALIDDVDGRHVSTRVENLSWSHHRVVAKLPAVEQEIALERARHDGLSVLVLDSLDALHRLDDVVERDSPIARAMPPVVVALARELVRLEGAAAA